MSDEGERLGDDLFPDSPEGQDPPPVASGSRSPSPPRRSASRSASPAKHSSPARSNAGDEDGDLEGDLFGDDDEPAGEPGSPRQDRDRSSSATPASKRSGSPNPLEYEEDDAPQEESFTANLILPDPPRMQATDGKIWHLKLPAYMNIESTPYDSDYFHEMAKGEEEIDGKKDPLLAKQKILRVKNTIRWKWASGLGEDPKPQSNARMVRWSDGSMSLQLGSDLFDVAPSIGTTLARPQDLQAQGEKKPVNGQSGSQDAGSSASTFLMVPAQNERVLTTEAPIAGQLSLVPTSSTSKTHMELVKHVGQQHVKHSRMKILDDLTDPAVNELLMKASGRDAKPAKPKTKRAGGSGGGRRSSRRMADSDSEGERPFASRKSGINYDSDDDGFIVDDEDEEEEAEATEDEDDMAYGSSRKSKSKSKSKKRKGDVDEDDDLDEMEEAERRIEQKERERKRAKRESKQKKSRDYIDTDDEEDAVGEPDEGEAEMDMDVESEED